VGGMEFTWRMVSALAWPAAVVVVALAFPWISARLDSLGISFGSFAVHVKTLNSKVDKVGQDISTTLSDNVPQPTDTTTDGSIPESLVDLMATVDRNRMEGIRAAFDLVHRALKETYPQLRRVLPAQLPQAMQTLVERGEMEADLAWSVQQLHELLVMPEWEKDEAGRTRAYAFLMLAEGAIHGVLRSARARGADSGPGAPIRSSWRGLYNDVHPIRLDITAWHGHRFEGSMTHPFENTVTSVTGSVEDSDNYQDEAGTFHLTWTEQRYTRTGRRKVDFTGYYSATVKGNVTMNGGWYYRADRRRVAEFTMTATEDDMSQPVPG
jgi:hypothetical protein